MVMCFCGRTCVVRTSWTSLNPGRRFFGCPKEDNQCGFFGWVDPPMCRRSVAIIPGLLRTINDHEHDIVSLTMEVRKLRMYLARGR